MMKNEKPIGSFQKVRKLVTVLRKCNGKAIIEDKDALISPKAAKTLIYCGVLLLAGALFAAGFFVQPYAAGFLSAKNVAQLLMPLLLILSFVLTIKDIVTVLYTADDLELLLPMPFSAGQIAGAKIIVASSFPVIFSFIVMNTLCLGFGIREGAGISFIIGTVLSGILIPVTGVAAAVLLIVVIFRVFGFIRNRDMTVALGGIFTFALTLAYIFISNRFQGGGSREAAAMMNVFASASSVLPNISFMIKFMFEGNIFGLLVSAAIPAVLVLLAILAVRAFYFDTALSMQSTGVKKKAVSQSMLRSGKKNTLLKALTSYEAKSARRNPAFMIYGFVMSFFWPVLFILPMVLGNNLDFGEVSFPIGTVQAAVGTLSFGVMASCFACGFNVLPGTAFTREGGTFGAIRALPIDLGDYCRGKRNSSLLICSFGSVLYVILLGIVSVALGFVSIQNSWMFVIAACVSFLLDLIFIDLMLWKDSVKPRFDWDSESEFSRKLGAINIIVMVIGIAMLMVFLLSIALGKLLDYPKVVSIVWIVYAAIPAAAAVAAPVVNHFMIKRTAENLEKIE